MSRSENLPTLPQAASQVLRLADDPDASPREIERAIEMDPAITAKILKVANSAYYGATSVPTIGRAISFLGLTTVRSVVISIAMQQMISGRTQCPSFDKLSYWRHSLAVATTARILGKIKFPARAEELFCAAMMQEIGILAMDKFVPQDLHATILKAREAGQPLTDVQERALGFSYIGVGVVLAKKWGMSALIQEAIQDQGLFDPFSPGADAAAVMSLSNTVAGQLGFMHSGLPAPPTDEAAAEHLAISEAQLGVVKDVVAQEIAKAQDTFQIAA